jgi:hypothetical protein
MENRIVGMAYLDECWLTMAGFSSASIAHCPREANMAAEMLNT